MSYNFNATLEQFLTDRKDKDDNHEVIVSADVGADHFLAITENSLAADAKTRNIKVQMIAISDATVAAGQQSVNSGPFVRGADEKHVSVELVDADGKQLALKECGYGI